MATIQDINSGSSYTGESALGGGFNPSVELNTKPLENLAIYTMLYNKEVWKQEQYETDQAIQKLSDLSTISLNNLVGKDKKQLAKEFPKLINYYSELATKIPKTPQEKIQFELDRQVKLGEFMNNYNSGKARAVKLLTEKNKIVAKYPNNVKAQEVATAALQKKFDETDIGTPIGDINVFTIETPELPKALTHTVHKVGIGDNQNVAVDLTYFNPVSNSGVAWAAANGVAKLNVPKTTKDKGGNDIPNPEYERQKEFQDIQATGEGQAEIWAKMAEPFNKVLQSHIVDGVFDEVGFRKELKSNEVLAPIIDAMDAMKKYQDEKQAQISQGIFTDDTNKEFVLPTDIKASDFDKLDIDLSTGNVSPDKLILAGMFAQYSGDEINKKLTYTGEKNKQKDSILERFKAETDRIRATKSEGGSEASAVIDKPAILFGQHIDRLKKSFAQGTEEVKVSYAGTDEKTRIAAHLNKGDTIIYKPDGNYSIVDAKGISKGSGTIENLAQGFIDAVKTIDLASGGKDATMAEGFQVKSENKFKQIFGTTSGKTIWDNWGSNATSPTTTTEEKVTETTTQTRKGKDGKVYTSTDGITWTASDGTTVKLKK